MKNPRVSVVVNNYNNEQYLRDCLEGLVNQTYDNIEIVIVDALSTDNSRKIIDEYATKHKNIKTIYTETYIKYPAISYNLGFLNCTGDFIAINDPDDISLKTRIEKQLEYLLDNLNIDVVGSNVIEFNENLERVIYTTVKENVRNAYPPARNPTLMFRKSLMAYHGFWRWQSEYAADFEWLYRWYSSGVTFYIIQEPLVKYRYSHGGNLSNNFATSQTYKLAIFRTKFGLKMIRTFSVFWWIKTLDTYYYLFSITVKKIFKKVKYLFAR